MNQHLVGDFPTVVVSDGPVRLLDPVSSPEGPDTATLFAGLKRLAIAVNSVRSQ